MYWWKALARSPDAASLGIEESTVVVFIQLSVIVDEHRTYVEMYVRPRARTRA